MEINAMIPEEMQRTMQFLLENQAGHDTRLAEIEVNLNKLTEKVSELAKNQHDMQDGMLTMQSEFREGLQKILTVSEQTMVAVRQVAEAEARTIRRVNVLEDRVDALENSGE
jgi:hypothetical protein